MKKLLLLPVLLFFAACSTDDNDLNLIQESELTNAQYRTAAADNSCPTNVSSSVYIDVSRGIDRPYVVFSGYVQGASNNVTYKARVEIEMLSDCEDITSGNGAVTIFALPGTIQPPFFTAPTVTVAGTLLPSNACYRWRFVVDGPGAGSKSKTGCSVASPWYDAPLF
ncbi:hypothetical protein AAEO56_03760 [Flavobacterium sp. DGU11]|uniref:Lipoprotein n=1 Tax=Flavobacterium arundinis TaxID=3139143 RepID=A0ABU9HT90_9FLAO